MGIKATDIVFGPFEDEFLGNSIGLNLLSGEGGACIHDCAYCNLSVAQSKTSKRNPEPYEVVESLLAFVQMKDRKSVQLESIVITGGGNPIDHAKFSEIVKDVLLVRDLTCPETKVVVVTSGKGIEQPAVLLALQLVDLCVLRFDPISIAGSTDQAHIELKKHLKKLKGNLTVQACLELTSSASNDDAAHEQERIQSWINDLSAIGARQAYLCNADRDSLSSTIPFFPKKKLEHIVNLLNAQNIRTQLV